jgi:hypothetical protein
MSAASAGTIMMGYSSGGYTDMTIWSAADPSLHYPGSVDA